MCLILFSYRSDSQFSLVVAANRDEFRDRPTAPAGPWPGAPHVIGGRDLKAGGTWFAVGKSGRWAAITNVREPERFDPGARSRGDLVKNYLLGTGVPEEYASSLGRDSQSYNGFNLLLGDSSNLVYVSNRASGWRRLESGTYGLSNAALDTPWPKVVTGKRQLMSALREGADHLSSRLFDVLSDESEAPDRDLPNTGVGLDTERQLSPLHIRMERYGTRSSTVYAVPREGPSVFVERTFLESGLAETRQFQLT